MWNTTELMEQEKEDGGKKGKNLFSTELNENKGNQQNPVFNHSNINAYIYINT